MSERVRVYRNLHKQCYSVQTYTPGVGWRVDHHADEIALVNAKFVINERGRQRVRDEKRKNVHAFVYGEVSDEPLNHDSFLWHKLTYNPYDDYGFQAVPKSFWSPHNITEASHVVLDPYGVFAWVPGMVGTQNKVQGEVAKPDFAGYTTDHE